MVESCTRSTYGALRPFVLALSAGHLGHSGAVDGAVAAVVVVADAAVVVDGVVDEGGDVDQRLPSLRLTAVVRDFVGASLVVISSTALKHRK